MRNSILLAFLICFSSLGFSQRSVRDSAIATPWIALHYGLNAPGGDLKDRFGAINHIGAMAGYKTSRNWVYGLDGNFMFGNRVKTSGMFTNLIDSHGYIHDANGDVAIVVVNMRGFNANAMVGKVIPVLSPNKNSGLYFHAGLGYTQYKIRVETQDQVVPTLELKYRKGYDRYTTGLNFHQFAGYAFMANQGFINFYAGFYIQEGLTYNRRDVFFDQPEIPVSKAQRLDLQYGFKVGWFVPVYKRKPKDYYFE